MYIDNKQSGLGGGKGTPIYNSNKKKYLRINLVCYNYIKSSLNIEEY